MSRTPLPFQSDDISALARSLETQLAEREGLPTHLELMNMLARATGYRNFQHFRAKVMARAVEGSAIRVPESPAPSAAATEAAAPPDTDRLKRVLRVFDAQGKLIRWPPKRSQQALSLWVIWSRIPVGVILSERQVNERLNEAHHFGDHALLRRWMVDYGMLTRTADGREYRRVEQRPPAEALELMRLVSAQQGRP